MGRHPRRAPHGCLARFRRLQGGHKIKRAFDSSDTPKQAGPYSKGIWIGDFFFTAGFGPQDPATGIVAEGITEQTRQVISNLAAILAAGGLTLDHIVKTTVHLADIERDFAAFNDEYRRHFSEPYPVRTTVGSVLPGILVEIDAVAVTLPLQEA